MKYKQEGGKLSYATFTRLKPFYVQRPNVNDRNTWYRRTRHSNLSFKANKLKALRLIETDNLSELVKQIACDSSSKDCMHSTCITCKNKVIDIKIPIDYVNSVAIEMIDPTQERHHTVLKDVYLGLGAQK